MSINEYDEIDDSLIEAINAIEDFDFESFLEGEEDEPFLCKYLKIFLLNNKRLGHEQNSDVLLYRGYGNCSFDLRPSVFRNNLLRKETAMIKDLLIQAPDGFISIENPYERLIKMQHYGLPTRLLDFTFNPLVALFFACKEEKNKDGTLADGEIVVVRDFIQHPDVEQAKWFASLAEYNGSSEKEFINFLTDKNLFVKDLQDTVSLLRHVKRIFTSNYVVLSAPRNNERIKRQSGAFLLFGLDVNTDNIFIKETFDIKEQLVRDFHDNINRTIKIPANEKKHILFELDSIGINESFLFPELEYQSKYIKEKYDLQLVQG